MKDSIIKTLPRTEERHKSYIKRETERSKEELKKEMVKTLTSLQCNIIVGILHLYAYNPTPKLIEPISPNSTNTHQGHYLYGTYNYLKKASSICPAC